MRKFLSSILSVAFLSILLLRCGNIPDLPPSDGFNTPSLLSSSGSDFDPIANLHLSAKLEVIQTEGNQTVREIPLEVHKIPLNSERPDGGQYLQIFPKEGIRTDGFKGGEHLFRMHLFHNDAVLGEIELAKIETRSNLERGKNTLTSFKDSFWDYNLDDDQDGFTNIAELTNGSFKEGDNGRGLKENWQSAATNPKDPNDHPNPNFILAKERIGSTSPDDQGNSILIGDARSVQAGTKFTIFHKKADGNIEKITFYSRLDGSFEVPVQGSGANDQITVVAASQLQGDEAVPPPDLNPNFGTSLTIQYHPIKMTKCGSFPGKDPIASNGSVILEGEGISSVQSQNEVLFPKVGGDYVKTTDFKISGKSARTIELTVNIPASALSGFPRVHTKTAQSESFGACSKNQDVVILQNNGQNAPDLYITLVDAPQIALLGQIITVDVHIVNQGLKEVENSIFPYYSYLSIDTPSSPNADLFNERTDRIIYPQAFDFTKSEGGPERINSRIEKGGKVIPSRNQFFFTRASLPKSEPGRSHFVGPVLFKGSADPLSSGFFGGGNSVLEQDEKNNSRAALWSSFIHYVDLGFLSGSPTIKWDSTDLELVANDKYYAPRADQLTKIQPLVLKKDGLLRVDLAPQLENRGNFPMVSKNGQYLPDRSGEWDAVDPLNTAGDLYIGALKLYEKRQIAEGEADLQKPLAVELIEQANAFNQNEYPVLIHAYYSEDSTFSPNSALIQNGESEDWPIDESQKIRKGEICLPRLERGAVDPTPISLDIPLDSEAILTNGGYLFIVAEVAQLDSEKVRGWKNKKENEGKLFDYCGMKKKEREDYNLRTVLSDEKSNPLNSLPDFDSRDNLVMIPINAQAPDLVVQNLTTNPSVVLGQSIPAQVTIQNIGNVKSEATNVAFYLSDSGSDVLVGSTPIGNIDPGPAVSQSIPLKLTTNLDTVPFGPNVKLTAKVDDPDIVFEANRTRTGESNNESSEITVNVTAPDLIIYGIGLSDCDGGGKCKSSTTPFGGRIDSSLNDSFPLDLYVKNIGTGFATGNYKINVEGIGASCPLKSSMTGSPVDVKQWVRIPVTVKIPKDAACKSTGNGGSPAGLNFSVSIQENPTDFYQRALGADGRNSALANDTIVSGGKNGYFRVKPGVDLPKAGEAKGEETLGNYFDTSASGEAPRFFIGQPELDIKDQPFNISACIDKICVLSDPIKTIIKIANHGDGVGKNVVLKPILFDKTGNPVSQDRQPSLILIPQIDLSDTPKDYPVEIKFNPGEHDPDATNYKLQFEINPQGADHIAELAKDAPFGTAEPDNNRSLQSEPFKIAQLDYSIALTLDKSSYEVNEPATATVTIKNRGEHPNVEDIEVDLYYGSSYLKTKERFLNKGDSTFINGASVTKTFSFTAPAAGIRPIPKMKALFKTRNGSEISDSKDFRVDKDMIAGAIKVLPIDKRDFELTNNTTFTIACTDPEGDPITYTWQDSSSGPSAYLGCVGNGFPNRYPGEGGAELVLSSTYAGANSNSIPCHLDNKARAGLNSGQHGKVSIKVTCDDPEDAYPPKSVEITPLVDVFNP